MTSTTHKSPAYYTIMVCLAIIGGALLWGLLWQPSFTDGYIFIPFLQGHLMFSLWPFVMALLSLALFFYLFIIMNKKGYPLKYLLAALGTGVTFVILSYFSLLGYGARAPSSALPDTGNALQLFSFLLWLIRGIIILSMLFLVYQWRRTAMSTGDGHTNSNP